MDYDYGVIGGGPAGYTVAAECANAGKRVVLFERDKLGGTCLNKGCIPTKALLHMSEEYKKVKESANIGLELEIKNFEFSKIAAKRDSVVEKIRKSLELAMKNAGVEIVYSEAKIKDKNTVLSEGINYEVGEILFAAGSKPREIKGLEFDHKFILNSDDVLKLNRLPKSVLIVGSGAIGIEWARIFSNFGCDVCIVESAEHLIPAADIDVSKRIERIFKQNKIKFYLKDSVKGIENRVVTLNSGTVIQPEIILSAVGRVPITSETKGVKTLGDSCGEIQLAHYAIQQAKDFVYNSGCDKTKVPFVIYGEPEIAWAGLREQDCPEDCKSVLLPITALGKSLCDDCTDGFIKIITKDDIILGAHIISKEASALIQEILIAIHGNMSINDLKQVCFAHPTYSEGIFEAICRL